MSPFSFALMINLYIFVLVCVLSRSVVSDSLRPHRLQPTRGFSAHGNSPDKNTGVGSLSLLQEIVPTQESNWGLLHCRQILYYLSYQGAPLCFACQVSNV